MTDEKQPKEQTNEEQEQADLRAGRGADDKVKGGTNRYRGPDKEPQASKASDGREQPKGKTMEAGDPTRGAAESERSRR